MTSDVPATSASLWPADPASAWAEAVRSPDRATRLSDPPDVDAADAASIADWIEDQRSVLPMFAVVAAAVGAFVIGGLLSGALPRSEPGGVSAEVLWTAGIGLLIASVLLWLWELAGRRRRRTRPPKLIPEVEIVLCQLYPTRFHIYHGDGYRGTCVAIDANTSDAQAARLLTAFGLWLGRVTTDPDAVSRARNEYWVPSGATVFNSEEIFGPEATGGYLVRRPNPPANGWAVLITPRRPAKLVGQLRFADVRQWTGHEWSL